MKALFSTRTINTIIAIGSAAILLYFLLFYSETGNIRPANNDAPANAKPDFYLTNVKSQHFDESGAQEFVVTGQSITHNPANNTSTVAMPVVEVFNQGVKTWIAKSQSGILHDKNKEIELHKKVSITNNEQGAMMKTNHLSIVPAEKIAQTSERVTLSVPNGFTRSDGMHVNLESQEIVLLQNVKGQYNVSP